MGRAAFAIGFGITYLWAQGCACGARCLTPTPPSIWPIAVRAYAFGTSQTFGQDPQYFPYNVLGVICTTATPTAPCADPCQVVSLGKGGYIELAFDPPIADGPGADFIVFENAFRYGNGQVFDEWMIVSVSQDGQTWLTFPYDSVTGEGLAGRTPTGCSGCSGEDINWQDPVRAGGDAFDLSEVGLAWARYVRVEDATRFQPPDRLSADLDGVVAIHQLSPNSLDMASMKENEELIACWDYLGRELTPASLSADRRGAVVCLVRKAGGYLYWRSWWVGE
jgi:hypothetical protein